MLAKSEAEFISFFKEIDDFREDGKILYPLDEILFLVFTAVLSCAESWELIVTFGITKLDMLRKYLPYVNGIPSESTLCRVMGTLNKTTLEEWFNNIFNTTEFCPKELIPIDGKSLKGSKRFNNKAIHMLNAYATKQGLVIAQKTVDSKTNEITALPELLDTLNIKDTVISTDAMGCQKKITEKIIEKKADYILAVKENHSNLLKDIANFFDNKKLLKTADFYEDNNKSHGRIENRKCWSMPVNDYLKREHQDWKKLQHIILVERTRTHKEKTTVEKQYYISSLTNNCAKDYLYYAREHWSIENKVHWVLDVTFNEDRCTIKKAAENMAIIRKLVLNLLKSYKSKACAKHSLNGLRRMAAWSDQTRNDILAFVS
jgi:predicted transposase YbfD/YdcC